MENKGINRTAIQAAADAPEWPVGTVQTGPDGKSYRYVKNNYGSALVAGYPVAMDFANGLVGEVNRPETATLQNFAGIALAAIPASGWGWIQRYGFIEDANVDGDSVDVVLGDTLKLVAAAFTLVHDQAAGITAPVGPRHCIALEANAGVAAPKNVFVLGL